MREQVSGSPSRARGGGDMGVPVGPPRVASLGLPLAVSLSLIALSFVGCPSLHRIPEGSGLTVGPDGWSGVLAFEVPPETASLTVVIDRDDAALVALGSLVFADGVEQIGELAMTAASSRGGGISGSPPNLVAIMPGTSAFQYPRLATQTLPAGRATLRVRSDRPGPVEVRLFFGDGLGRDLHISLVSFRGEIDAEPGFVRRAAEILAPAGVRLVLDEVVVAPTRPAIRFETATPPPGDEGAALFDTARSLLRTDALPVLVVELADESPFGLSRGLPGPPIPGSHRRAVFLDPTHDPSIAPDLDALVGRILAHELGHQLGLHHPDDQDVLGATVGDGLGDTVAFDETLMGSMVLGQPPTAESLRISPEQVFSMTRSALLE
jgi:hypothetical protein